MADPAVAQRADAIRAFNRQYTPLIGVLTDSYLNTPYPLAAVRIVYELGARGEAIAADLARDLGLDRGYLSRLVNRLRRDGLIERRTADRDRRQVVLSLTGDGKTLLAQVDRRSRDEITRLIERMPEADQRRLVQALQTATRVLAGGAGRAPIILRGHRPGDMGWVVEAHGRIYASEFGWDGRFEALIAEIVAGFLRTFDPACERCWIAEQEGERVGSVFVVRQDDEAAKLRLLLVDPAVRGAGLGRALVRECIAFARAAGYRHLRLWTNDVLAAARAIYESEGFTLIDASPHADFGIPMIGETWDLKL